MADLGADALPAEIAQAAAYVITRFALPQALHLDRCLCLVLLSNRLGSIVLACKQSRMPEGVEALMADLRAESGGGGGGSRLLHVRCSVQQFQRHITCMPDLLGESLLVCCRLCATTSQHTCSD